MVTILLLHVWLHLSSHVQQPKETDFIDTCMPMHVVSSMYFNRICLFLAILKQQPISVVWAHVFCMFLGVTSWWTSSMRLKILQSKSSGLCSCRAWWPLVPNLHSWVTQKSYFFSCKSYAEHPKFYRFRVLCSLEFSLKHSLVIFGTNEILA